VESTADSAMRSLDEILTSVRNLFRSDPWGSFDVQAWRDLPHLAGRLATETDVQDDRAVFYQAGGGVPARPHEIAVPVCAVLHDADTGESVPVVIIQAEYAETKVVVGYRLPRGGNGIATLPEMELLAHPDERFLSR